MNTGLLCWAVSVSLKGGAGKVEGLNRGLGSGEESGVDMGKRDTQVRRLG